MFKYRAERFLSLLSSLRVPVLAGLLILPAVSPAIAANLTFVDVTAQAFPDGLANGHYLWGDCDGDGDQDLLVGGKTLYLNGGPPDYTFTRKTDTGDLATGPHARAIWIDFDNDGDLDLFGIGSGDNERLYENDGTCRFTDVSDFNGDGDPTDLGDGAPSTTASTGDYDGDGFLDVYVGNYERNCGGDPLICGDCMTDRLWHNQGDGTFADVTVSSGIYGQEHALAGYCYIAGTPCDTDDDCSPYPQDSCKSGTCARGSNWVDYDNDGDMDIFVSNYRLDPNLLWENDGVGNFTNVSFDKNVDGDEDNGAWGHVLGSDWGDFDNDGDMDLYTADLAHCAFVVAYGHDISQLLESSGAPNFTFTDIRPSSGMRQYDEVDNLCLSGTWPDWTETSPAWADYDNDGDLDIYITRIYDSSTKEYSELYSNDGDHTFTETSQSHGANLRLYRDYSATWCDYDQDGDLDLITYGAEINTGTATARLYRNDGGNADAWLHVRVVGQAGAPGTGTNRFGVGVRVTATHAAVTQMREVQGGFGYHTEMNSMPVEFGFGPASDDTVDEVTIRWTTGTTDTYSAVPMNVRALAFESGITLRRGSDPSVGLPVLDPAAKFFPYDDPSLGDPDDYYYTVDRPGAVIDLDKDTGAGVVRILIR